MLFFIFFLIFYFSIRVATYMEHSDMWNNHWYDIIFSVVVYIHLDLLALIVIVEVL
jgi:hypothetical protein